MFRYIRIYQIMIMMMMICFDRYYKSLIRTKATSPISLPARQAVH
jgi:hypothetical protein